MRIGAREESIASVQLDFLSAARFDLSFAAKSGQRERPWIVHRAPLGSHERFVAMLLEFYDGQLPAWLSPVQLFVLPLSENEQSEARALVESLRAAGIRAKLDESAGHLSKRIALARRFRPFARVVIGPREIASGLLSLQLRQGNLEIWRANLRDEMKKWICPPRIAR